MSMRCYCTDRRDHENYANDPWMNKCLDDSEENQHDKFYKDIAGRGGGVIDLNQLTHVNERGEAHMVDISDKEPSIRRAAARAVVWIGADAFRLVKDNQIRKGDVLKVAEIAGITASKLTWQLIPLCHPLAISKVDVQLSLNEGDHSVVIESCVTCKGPTGVEMEALTAVSVAALTVYDMIKAVTKQAEIRNIQLISKSGGVGGDFYRS